MIWLAFAALTTLALLVALPSLLKQRNAPLDRNANDLAVYRAQLAEIDADLARATINPSEAEAARIEVKRRIIALPDATSTASPAAPTRTMATALGAAIAAASLAVYFALGHPAMPSHFYDAAAEQAAADKELATVADEMIAKIAARLKEQPNDPTGWRLLGTAYVKLGRYKEGTDALARAVALSPEDASLHAQYGEALMQAASGKATPEALTQFDEALKRDPKDPRARFYKGLALVQAGKDKEALDSWIAIIRDAPTDADWLPAIRAQAQDLAAKLKLDPKSVP